jgi:hypothetical protein
MKRHGEMAGVSKAANERRNMAKAAWRKWRAAAAWRHRSAAKCGNVERIGVKIGGGEGENDGCQRRSGSENMAA